MNPEAFDYHVASLEAHPGLTCRFLKPPEFRIAELPPEEVDFERGTQFMPVAVALAESGPMVFTVAARPSYDDGALSQWLEYLCEAEGYPHTPVRPMLLGELHGVTCDARQQVSDGMTMYIRFALIEDGGRLFQMSAMAPELLWNSAIERMAPMLASFELRERRGSRVPLAPGERPPGAVQDADPAPAEPAGARAVEIPVEPFADPDPGAGNAAAASGDGESAALMTPEEFRALALAEGAQSLDADHPLNAKLRDSGAGLVPRVFRLDAQARAALLGCAAIAGFIRVPFGWHVIDDGRRTLVFDADGRIQINLSLRRHEGRSPGDCARALVEPYLDAQPDLQPLAFVAAGVDVAGVRGASIDGAVLDQIFLVRDLGDEALYLVARLSASAEDASRGLDLAGELVVRFSTTPPTA